MRYTLCETDKLLLIHEYESVKLIEKHSTKVLFEDDFYGDPSCGLIDSNNKWAIVAGEHISLWTPNKSKIFTLNDLKWIHALRIINLEHVEILIDPWSIDASIWQINTKTFSLKKIKEFNDYKNKEFTDKVIW